MTAAIPENQRTTTTPQVTTDHRTAPIPFHRLVAVEMRKLFDTTTNKVLALAMVAMIIGLVALRGMVAGPELDLLFATTTIAFATILPVLGILSITSEFGHRTALTTFALEPRRARVMLAKCIPPVISAVLATGFALLAALPATAITAQVQGVPADWTLELLPTLGRIATNIVMVGFGLGLGMLLLNAPAAIVIALGSMMAWNVVRLLGDAGVTLRAWLDLNATTGPLAHGSMTGVELARLAASVALWIVLPITAGIVRIIRKEVH
ncbi:MAG: hypothetical protein ACTH2Q_14180 [Propionibacteriaceae bacterium]